MRSIAFSLVFLLLTSAAEAQTFGEPYGGIYMSGSPDGRDFYESVGVFEPFQVYVLAELDYADGGHPEWNLTNGIFAWEAATRFDPEIMVTSSVTNPTNAVNLGSGGNWLIGLGMVFLAADSPHRLVTFTCMLVEEGVDLLVQIGPSNPSTFGTAPGFVDGQITGECALPGGTPIRCKRPFEWKRSLVVNCHTLCPPDPIEGMSWGEVKSRFLN